MPRIRVSHKLLAIFLLDMVTAVYLAGVVLHEAEIAIDFARLERVGVRFLNPVQDAFLGVLATSGTEVDANRLRAASRQITRAALQLKTADPAVTRALHIDAVVPGVASILDRAAATGSAADRYDAATAVTALRALIQRVGDGSNLILDPQLDSYYTMSVALVQTPDLLETLFHVQACLQAIPQPGAGRRDIVLTPRQQAAISGLAARLETIARDTDAALEAGYRGNSDGSLRRAVDPPFRDLLVALIAPQATLTRIIDQGALSQSARRQALSEIDLAVQATATPWRGSFKALDHLLEARISLTRHRAYLHLALGGALLTSTLVLVLIVAGSIATPIGLLANVARRVRETNDYSLRANWQGRDELGELIGVFNDMLSRLYSENIRAQEMIGRSRAAEAQRTLIESIPVPLVVWREDDQRLLHVNPSATILLGVRMGDGDGLKSWLSPDDRQTMLSRIAETGGVSEFAATCRDASGHPTWTVIAARRLLFEGHGAVLAMVTPINERRRIEAELIAAKEQAEAAFRDLRVAQRNLVQAEKLASLGALVAGVAHEINTPIGIALTAATLLQERTATLRALYDDERMTEEAFTDYLAVMADTGTILVGNIVRAATLVQGFKQVAVDQTSAERRRFDLAEYLSEVVQTLGPRLKNTGVVVEIQCPPGLEIDGYPGALAQVITNIVLNALIHAFDGPSGLITISVDRIDPDDRVRLLIRDNGKGIEPENIPRIFDPFFTTRRGAGGSGLGLHIVYNRVTSALSGTIDVSSELGKGTMFSIEFPRTREFTQS